MEAMIFNSAKLSRTLVEYDIAKDEVDAEKLILSGKVKVNNKSIKRDMMLTKSVDNETFSIEVGEKTLNIVFN